MPRTASPHPTEMELKILKILWRIGPATVREVREELAALSDPAYTTVMTLMGIMTKKGYLSRRKKGPGYVYRPRVTEESVKKTMLSDLVDRAFEGSTLSVMLNLIETEGIRSEELEELRKLIDKKRKEESK